MLGGWSGASLQHPWPEIHGKYPQGMIPEEMEDCLTFNVLFLFFPKQRGRCRGPCGFQWPHGGSPRGVPPIFDHPYRRFATWPSNSHDKTAIQFRILDRGVDFWGPKSIIFECMQQNDYFFIELTNVSWKNTTFDDLFEFCRLFEKIDDFLQSLTSFCEL